MKETMREYIMKEYAKEAVQNFAKGLSGDDYANKKFVELQQKTNIFVREGFLPPELDMEIMEISKPVELGNDTRTQGWIRLTNGDTV